MADYLVKTGRRLIDYLSDMGYTRTKVKQLMKHRAVEVNEKAAQGYDHLLQKGDKVSVRKEKRESKVVAPLGIKIIFEDEDLIVIEKPAGLLTIASETEKTKTAYYQLNEVLKRRSPRTGERIFIVHRLDRDTSGVMVFAKNEKVKRTLQEGWKEVEKRYYALVEGRPAKKEGWIRSRLSETKSLKVYIDPHSEGARLSETKYQVIKAGREYSLLDILLETGRKNQIRVHLSGIGHPVVGDKKYGAKTNPIARLGLHSYRLLFKHPVTGKPLRFESKLPASFNRLISKS
ncbi:MAG: RluA family pseudouridine synthase [Nitrospiraceae bacterium]|nr:MAG: RluA family pseudouridine synthase [Nitrospiraceae bacterium]